MHPGHSYAVSNGEGTLIEYGWIADYEVGDLLRHLMSCGYTVIIGPQASLKAFVPQGVLNPSIVCGWGALGVLARLSSLLRAQPADLQHLQQSARRRLAQLLELPRGAGLDDLHNLGGQRGTGERGSRGGGA